MSDYVMHNIRFIVPNQYAMNFDEDPGMPVRDNPLHYFAKLFGRTGSQLPLKRQRRGKGDEEVVNQVLRNSDEIVLLRIHNKESVNVVDKDASDVSEIPEYKNNPLDSYPYAYVVIDFRKDKTQIAIEKSSSWDSKTETIKKILLDYFEQELDSKYKINVSIDEKTEATLFEDFIEERTVDHGDIIESFTFEYPNLKRNPTTRIPETMTSNIQQMSDILEKYNAISGKLDMRMGQDVNKDQLKQLSTVVSYSCDNAFELVVKFRNHGEYHCNESILAKYPMNDIVIENYRKFADPEVKSSDFDLVLWLDEAFEKTKETYGKQIHAKPKGDN